MGQEEADVLAEAARMANPARGCCVADGEEALAVTRSGQGGGVLSRSAWHRAAPHAVWILQTG